MKKSEKVLACKGLSLKTKIMVLLILHDVIMQSERWLEQGHENSLPIVLHQSHYYRQASLLYSSRQKDILCHLPHNATTNTGSRIVYSCIKYKSL